MKKPTLTFSKNLYAKKDLLVKKLNTNRWTAKFTQWPMLFLVISFIANMLHMNLVAAGALALALVALLPFANIGIVTRFVFLTILLASSNTLIGLLTWLLKIPFTVDLMLRLYMGAGLILLILLKKSRTRVTFPREDIFSLAVSLLFMGILLFPLTLSRSTAALVSTMGGGVDNIAHLALIRSIEDHHNYLNGYQPAIDNQMTGFITSYPQGFHLNMALANQLIKPVDSPRPVRQALFLYIILTTLDYGILFYLFVHVGIYLSKKIIKKKIWLAGPIATATAAYIFLGTLIVLFLDGFQTQICSLSLLMGLIAMLLHVSDAKELINKKFYAYGALLLCIGIGFVYFYILPIALVVAVAILLNELRKKALPRNILFQANLLILTLLSLSPVILYSLYPHETEKLAAVGGTIVFNNFTVITFALFAFAGLLSRVAKREHLVILGLFLLSSVFFTEIIFAQQVKSLGEVRYYYFKSTYTIIILAGLTLVPALVAIMQKVRLSQFVLIMLALCSLLWGARPPYVRLYLERRVYAFSPQFGAVTANLLTSQNPTQIISIGNNCIDDDDIRLMRLIMAVSGRSTPGQIKIAETQFARNVQVLDDIRDYQLKQPDKKLTIVTTDPVIRNIITEKAGADAAYLQFIDPYAGTTRPVTGCSDF